MATILNVPMYLQIFSGVLMEGTKECRIQFVSIYYLTILADRRSLCSLHKRKDRSTDIIRVTSTYVVNCLEAFLSTSMQ